jgi:hypothetical protein
MQQQNTVATSKCVARSLGFALPSRIRVALGSAPPRVTRHRVAHERGNDPASTSASHPPLG